MNSRSEKDLKYKHLKSEYVFTSILSGLTGIFFSLNAYFLEGKRHESQHLETLLSGGITNRRSRLGRWHFQSDFYAWPFLFSLCGLCRTTLHVSRASVQQKYEGPFSISRIQGGTVTPWMAPVLCAIERVQKHTWTMRQPFVQFSRKMHLDLRQRPVYFPTSSNEYERPDCPSLWERKISSYSQSYRKLPWDLVWSLGWEFKYVLFRTSQGRLLNTGPAMLWLIKSRRWCIGITDMFESKMNDRILRVFNDF